MRNLPIEMCTGCTACASICPQNCINMISNYEGFLYPIIETDDCVNCGLCEDVCPLINHLCKETFETKAYAAYSINENIRMESSSGGVFSEIAMIILKRGGSVYGAAYDEEFNVVHICVENENDLSKLRGAKYAQSDLGKTFRKIKIKLAKNQLVLFSGTPCQVAGLKSYLCNSYKNLITMDFVCHSVPSPMVWREYVKYRAREDNSGVLPININLRSKDSGWSRYQYSNKFEYENGIVNNCKNADSVYMKLFVGGHISRKSCEGCKFKGYSRNSDITIGDFWGIWDILSEMDDNKGTSVVIVQSIKGKKVIDCVKDKLKIIQIPVKETSQQNPAMIVSLKASKRKAAVIDVIRSGNFEECFSFIGENNGNLIKRIKERIRQYLI